MLDAVTLDVIGRMRTRSHQAHVSEYHVPELGKLIQTVPSQERTHSCNSRVMQNLEECSLTFITAAQTFFFSLGTRRHGAKFEAHKAAGTLSYSYRSIERCSRRIKFDYDGDQEQQRGKNDQRRRRQNDVHYALAGQLPLR